ncbi:MAG: phasin family protein [Candidatus Binataceae bacterium]
MSGNASRAAVQELTRAYQELATKNAKNLTAAMQALAAVKSPAEFIELQQRLISRKGWKPLSVIAGTLPN